MVLESSSEVPQKILPKSDASDKCRILGILVYLRYVTFWSDSVLQNKKRQIDLKALRKAMIELTKLPGILVKKTGV